MLLLLFHISKTRTNRAKDYFQRRDFFVYTREKGMYAVKIRFYLKIYIIKKSFVTYVLLEIVYEMFKKFFEKNRFLILRVPEILKKFG